MLLLFKCVYSPWLVIISIPRLICSNLLNLRYVHAIPSLISFQRCKDPIAARRSCDRGSGSGHGIIPELP